MQNQITYTQALEWINQIRDLLQSTGSLKPSYVAPLNAIISAIESNAKVENMPSIVALKAKAAKTQTCVFRAKLDTHSTANWTPGPAQTGH